MTEPWAATLPRTHRPRPRTGRRSYRRYTSCLRWDHGFFCTYCLLHESDFAAHGRGVARSGLFGVDHLQPVSDEPELVNDYRNLRYACHLCNTSKGAQLPSAGSTRLAEPCSTPMAERLRATGDELEPLDPDAQFTVDVLELNEPRKVAMRRNRRETVEECLAVLEQGPGFIDELLARSASTRDLEDLDLAERLGQLLRPAKRQLLAFRLVPEDAPEGCDCEQDVELSVSDVIARQCHEVETGDD